MVTDGNMDIHKERRHTRKWVCLTAFSIILKSPLKSGLYKAEIKIKNILWGYKIHRSKLNGNNITRPVGEKWKYTVVRP